MKSLRIGLALFLAVVTTAAFAQSDAGRSFQALKSLAGSWQGSSTEGPVRVTYRVTSAGHALMSEIEGHENMITMFHLDGDRLLMTHYCAVGNQPRMKASVSPDRKTFTFEFLDATNVSSSQPGHMQRLVLTLLDAGHHTEEWVFAAAGRETKTVFDLRRE